MVADSDKGVADSDIGRHPYGSGYTRAWRERGGR
jgi:hypothetical protein